jgi:hypothetical protein
MHAAGIFLEEKMHLADTSLPRVNSESAFYSPLDSTGQKSKARRRG